MSRLVRGWSVLIALSVIALGGFGCIGGTSSTQPSAPAVVDPPGPVATTRLDTAGMYSTADAPPLAEASDLVDASSGGLVSNGLVSVEIPPGALAANDSVRIVMQPGRRLVFDVSVDQAIHNRFLVPVVLKVDLSGQAVVAQPALYWRSPSDGLWYGLTSSTYDSTTHILSAPVSHFSTYAAGSKAGW